MAEPSTKGLLAGRATNPYANSRAIASSSSDGAAATGSGCGITNSATTLRCEVICTRCPSRT